MFTEVDEINDNIFLEFFSIVYSYRSYSYDFLFEKKISYYYDNFLIL